MSLTSAHRVVEVVNHGVGGDLRRGQGGGHGVTGQQRGVGQLGRVVVVPLVNLACVKYL